MKKVCTTCDEEFEAKKANQKYCTPKCRDKFWCQKYYQKNRERILKKSKTPEFRQKQNEYNKTPERRAWHSKYLRDKKLTDGKYKLKHRIIDRIRTVEEFKRFKHGKLEKYLGYNIDTLYQYLIEKLDGFTEKDFLIPKKLEIDHIIPFHWYIVQNLGDDEFKKCWDMKNLRLISPEQNRKRRCKKFDWDEIEEYDLIDILPKGANEIYRERFNINDPQH